MKRCSIALCLLVLLVARTYAEPGYWIDPLGAGADEPNPPTSKPGCTDHPDAAYGNHKGPEDDTTVDFTLALSGKTVTSVCPGKTYTLKVSWPTGGSAIVTTTVGTLSDSADTCKNRAIFESGDISYSTNLVLPASATGSVVLKATFVAGSRDAFHQNSLTVPISSTGCSTATATPPATTTPRPPTTTTTPPSTTPSDSDDDGDDDGDDDDGKGKGTTTTSTTPASTTPPATTTTTPSSETGASSSSSAVTTFNATMCKQPVQSNGGSCTKSDLGYSCSTAMDRGLTTHWTVGGCPPSNACTKTYTLRNTAANPAQTYLHYAATYKTTGYVAVGFARNPGHMAGTDAVIGWVNSGDAAPTVDAYYIDSSDSLSRSNKYADDQTWMVLSGASATSDGYTTICFSRPITAPSSKILAAMPTSAPVGMNWAVGRNNQRTLTEHTYAAGYTFNPLSGVTAIKDASDKYIVYHGVLMALAWVALAPLGVLFARHRWALGDFKLGKVHFWFHAHRAIQFVAIILFAAGLALAYVKLGDPEGGIGKAHSTLAIVLAALAGLQVVAAFIRPPGDHPRRRAWNLFHWNLGRLTLATGIINTFLGVVVYKKKSGDSVTAWFVVLGAALGAFVVSEVVLSLLSLRKGAAAPAPPAKDVADIEVARLEQQQQQQTARMYPQHSANVV